MDVSEVGSRRTNMHSPGKRLKLLCISTFGPNMQFVVALWNIVYDHTPVCCGFGNIGCCQCNDNGAHLRVDIAEDMRPLHDRSVRLWYCLLRITPNRNASR